MALLLGAGLGLAQDAHIRGSVSTVGGRADVRAWQSGRHEGAISTQTSADGSYLLSALPAGIYDLKMSADNFVSVEVRGIPVSPGSDVVVPFIRLESIGLVGDCSAATRPDYYRLSAGASGTGGLAGIATSGTLVTLFARGTGRVSSVTTGASGHFDFVGLQVGRDYSITFEQDGFFMAELSDLAIVPGFVIVFGSIEMEACSLGHCQPALKTIRVLPSCA